MNSISKAHWEAVYETKSPNEVSWTQQVPKISLDLIHALPLNKSAKIIDVGGGDSKLVDYLSAAGFENITVLDISHKALERAKQRLGNKAEKVNWIVCDITDFIPTTSYDLWHDRATFHFFTTKQQIDKYKNIVKKAVSGYSIIGVFSENGPLKCSGLEIKQYNETQLSSLFKDHFEKISCLEEDHITPFNTRQNFLFCSFKRITNTRNSFINKKPLIL